MIDFFAELICRSFAMEALRSKAANQAPWASERAIWTRLVECFNTSAQKLKELLKLTNLSTK